MSTTATLPLTAMKTRVSSIDVLRGLVMVIMALDHTRDFLHTDGFFRDPLDLATTTPILYFTRWITHFCAPTFAFLAGTSAFLSGQKKTKRELSTFLLTRGLWLVLLEITIVNFSFWFDVTFSFILLQIIWAIGMSMIILSGIIFLPKRAILIIGLAILFGHNLLDGVSFENRSVQQFLWSLLHQRNFIPVTPHFNLMVAYPVLPWIGIIALGYCFGELYGGSFGREKRKKWLLFLGVGAVVGFVIIRAVNIYGDPSRWSTQPSGLYTMFSFLNTTKYPPSLLYTLMTLGPGMLFLYWIEEKRSWLLDFFRVYGRVPLFYYVTHFYIIHTLAVISLLLSGIPWSAINFQNGTGGTVKGVGLSLGMMYVVWLLVVLSLYPWCKWYAGFKRGQQSRVWSYL